MNGHEHESLLRDLAPRVLGSVVRRFGDFAAAEDSVQEALLAAATQWPREGLPDNPRGWLIQVAMRRMTDQIRADVARRRREAAAIEDALQATTRRDGGPDADDDDTLVLLYTCCHPALTRSSAIALTLRAVGGLTTAEIASAYLVPEATLAQRISRAKQSIRKSGVRFEMPAGPERAERLDAVLHVLYLIFNEGYASSSGEQLQRTDLSSEAIRLTRIVHRRLPEAEEVSGLLALLLLTDARRRARTGADGELIPLAEQDRRLWDRRAIDEGTTLITRALARRAVGPYQIQAAIAAVHDEAPSAAATDWPQILALYNLLQHMTENPVVALNRAIALAMVRGPQDGIEAIDALASDPRMAGHYRLDAVRAHLLGMAGDGAGAVLLYRRAAERTLSIPERNYLAAQGARLASSQETSSSVK